MSHLEDVLIPTPRRLAFLVIALLIGPLIGFIAVAGEVAQPVTLAEEHYVQSETCMRCHPDHHESWAQTYHRTMTQVAAPQTVLGDFNNTSYTYDGVTSRFTQEGERFFMETLAGDGQMRRFEIARTVGSRRIQQYVTFVGDRYLRLPVAWNIEEGAWFHLNGGFLDPDGTAWTTHTALWDANCIFCHNVKPNPGYDWSSQTFDSEVAELGIACEACHGPGEAHIARNTNPLRRYYLHLTDQEDPTIISPPELLKAQQVQICGHCHGQRLPNPTARIQAFMAEGDPYTPGDDLSQYTAPIWQDTHLEGVDLSLRFWQDGTPRLTAYEYQGLLQSTVHWEESDLTCTSCHSMHTGDPKGMITAEMRGPQGCVQCHAEIARDVSAHTKHAPQSSGSDCYACHMPKITYGILNIHPSHRITNPDPTRAWRSEMPEACTLCHTTETALWATQAMHTHYGVPLPADLPTAPEFQIAENLRALLSGDVVQRAVAIAALSDEQTALTDPTARLWAAPFLLITMEDRYPALRFMAFRSLRTLTARAAASNPALAPSLAALPPFDALAEAPARQASLEAWHHWWRTLDKSAIPHPGAAVPLDQTLNPIPSLVQPLLNSQDQTAISIGE